MSSPLPLPVPILRLPLGPDPGGSRGFRSSDPRGDSNSRAAPELQRSRAALRERFLLLLGLARARPVRFSLWAGLAVDAQFGAADLEPSRFQVDSLRTPLGIQGSALLRASDVLAFSF
ncbi:GEMI7 protein, partial [Erpornis zantholeuca]|nr:GEMI7 protein [Erpornis zantholeuca]